MELEQMELEPSVVVFTALALLVAAAVLLRRFKTASSPAVSSSAATGADDVPPLADPLQTVPEPNADSENEPEPIQESCAEATSATETLHEPACGSEAVSIPDPVSEPPTRFLPDPVEESLQETISEVEPVLASHLGPETAPQPEGVTKPEPVPVLSAPETAPQLEPARESLSEPEPAPESVTQPESVSETPGQVLETITPPEPVPEPVQETVTRLESAIESNSALDQVSESTAKPGLKQLSHAEPSSEPKPEAVSEPVSIAQVAPEFGPRSQQQSALQSESEVLLVVTEPVSVHPDESVATPPPRSDLEQPQTSEPASSLAVDAAPQVEPELNGEAAAAAEEEEEDKVTFTPGKKANKFETLMTKEEMEEEQS